MAIVFHIPGPLRAYSGGVSPVQIESSPATLRDALNALWMSYPGLRDRVLTEQGEIRQHINVFVGDENSRYSGGLATRISTGAVISIVPSISGG